MHFNGRYGVDGINRIMKKEFMEATPTNWN